MHFWPLQTDPRRLVMQEVAPLESHSGRTKRNQQADVYRLPRKAPPPAPLPHRSLPPSPSLKALEFLFHFYGLPSPSNQRADFTVLPADRKAWVSRYSSPDANHGTGQLSPLLIFSDALLSPQNRSRNPGRRCSETSAGMG